MKVMFAGDVHGNESNEEATEIIFQAAKDAGCARIFQLGDFGYWEHELEGIDFLNLVNSQAEETGIPLYFLDGNHDKLSLLLQLYKQRDAEGFIQVREHVRYSPRGHRWTWDGLRFVSFGGAYSTDKRERIWDERKLHLKIAKKNAYRAPNNQVDENTSGKYWFPEEEMSDNDMDNFLLEDSSPVDIMLTHDKPRASAPRWNRKDLPECWPNQDRLQRAVMTLKPKVFLHGHLHYRYVDQILCGDNYQYTTVMGLDADGKPGSTHVIDLVKYREALNEGDYNQDAWW